MTYKNKTDQKLVIPGIGQVEANGTIETDQKIENTNFEEISAPAQQTPPAPAPQQPQPAAEQAQGGTK